GVVVHRDGPEPRRLPVRRRSRNALPDFQREDAGERAVAPRCDDLETAPAPAERAPPRGEPPRPEERRGARPIGQIVPFLGERDEVHRSRGHVFPRRARTARAALRTIGYTGPVRTGRYHRESFARTVDTPS